LRLSRWGIFSIALFAGALVLYVFLHFSTIGLGIVAAARGNKWWLLISLLSALLAAQAILALLVGDVG
jgi:hypothetical protein